MTEEYFNEHVLRCKKCGSKPLLVTENSMYTKDDDDKFRDDELEYEPETVGNPEHNIGHIIIERATGCRNGSPNRYTSGFT